MKTPRVAIATGLHPNPRGTQVKFHIANLFGGNTVVMSALRGPDQPGGPPHFLYAPRKDRKLSSRVGDAVERLGNLAKYRSIKVPYGQTRIEMIDFLKREDVDVVLSEFGNVAPRLAPIAQAAGLPIFTYFRGIDASAHLRKPLRLSSYKRAMPALTGVFAVSQFLLDNLAAAGVHHPNSFVVPSGVDTSLFQPAKKTPFSCLAVGRLIEKKRPDITIRAFLAATKDIPEARLDVIGEGPFDAQCRAIIAASDASQKVTMHGAMPHDVVRQHLAESEVFLQHSVTGANGDTEGLPTSIQEAMACGAIVVSTRHAGIPEAVEHGTSGYLVDEGDEAGFADALRTALRQSDDDKAKLSSVAHQIAIERLDNRKLVGFVEDKIRELCNLG